MFLPLEYIKYRWNAKGRHGIHSPFVYDFTDNCLRIQLSKADKDELSKRFRALARDQREIEIQDFGAGSKKLGNTRKISLIFRMSSSRGKYGELLYRLSKHYAPDSILELGTSLGIGSTYLNLGNTESILTTVEACKNTRSIAQESLSKKKNIESVLSTFSDFIAHLPKEKQFDLIFIDGHHDGAALLEYLDQLQAHAHDETLFILDDIRWSNSMVSAWEKIVADSRFHLSMDLFRVGIVARRSHQQKEHFVIRY
ncbi:MAG: class I SAM-dependent methyltransferase [Flavobacteriales bacterium]|nr:class I SAM-dependent methyltransferase [Flavobacteriales bacterium]